MSNTFLQQPVSRLDDGGYWDAYWVQCSTVKQIDGKTFEYWVVVGTTFAAQLFAEGYTIRLVGGKPCQP